MISSTGFAVTSTKCSFFVLISSTGFAVTSTKCSFFVLISSTCLSSWIHPTFSLCLGKDFLHWLCSHFNQVFILCLDFLHWLCSDFNQVFDRFIVQIMEMIEIMNLVNFRVVLFVIEHVFISEPNFFVLPFVCPVFHLSLQTPGVRRYADHQVPGFLVHIPRSVRTCPGVQSREVDHANDDRLWKQNLRYDTAVCADNVL
uniref:Uncharacterized protein n=2 Tax=Cacopsylla melanoneura TaxID=428564 RepID=A0A8D9AMY3_9HEMI